MKHFSATLVRISLSLPLLIIIANSISTTARASACADFVRSETVPPPRTIPTLIGKWGYATPVPVWWMFDGLSLAERRAVDDRYRLSALGGFVAEGKPFRASVIHVGRVGRFRVFTTDEHVADGRLSRLTFDSASGDHIFVPAGQVEVLFTSHAGDWQILGAREKALPVQQRADLRRIQELPISFAPIQKLLKANSRRGANEADEQPPAAYILSRTLLSAAAGDIQNYPDVWNPTTASLMSDARSAQEAAANMDDRAAGQAAGDIATVTSTRILAAGQDYSMLDPDELRMSGSDSPPASGSAPTVQTAADRRVSLIALDARVLPRNSGGAVVMETRSGPVQVAAVNTRGVPQALGQLLLAAKFDPTVVSGDIRNVNGVDKLFSPAPFGYASPTSARATEILQYLRDNPDLDVDVAWTLRAIVRGGTNLGL